MPTLTDTVSLASTLFTRRLTRVVVLCLLSVVMPLRGAAVGVFTAMGPAHVHQPAPEAWVLDDGRHWRPAPVAQTHVFAAFVHFHAGATLQRHYHSVDDASVVGADASRPDADEALSASALSVVAPIPAVLTWSPLRAIAAPDAGPLWALRTAFSFPLDRPPRRA